MLPLFPHALELLDRRTSENIRESMNVRPGLEVLLDEPQPIRGKRIGLVTNQSAVTSDIRHAVRLLTPVADGS